MSQKKLLGARILLVIILFSPSFLEIIISYTEFSSFKVTKRERIKPVKIIPVKLIFAMYLKEIQWI